MKLFYMDFDVTVVICIASYLILALVSSADLRVTISISEFETVYIRNKIIFKKDKLKESNWAILNVCNEHPGVLLIACFVKIRLH